MALGKGTIGSTARSASTTRGSTTAAATSSAASLRYGDGLAGLGLLDDGVEALDTGVGVEASVLGLGDVNA